MAGDQIDACVPVDIADEDIYEAMTEIPGYLDITPGDFKEIYLKAYEHALRRLTRSVKVGEVMNSEVVHVATNTPVLDVAKLMAEKRVSGVPVLSGDGSVAGVISERDFLTSMGAGTTGTFMEVIAECLEGGGCVAAPIRAKYASDIMSSPAITVNEETLVAAVAHLLTRKSINRVPVIDANGRLIGIVSRADIINSSSLGGGQ